MSVKRVYHGTAPALTAGVKVGSASHEVCGNGEAEFIAKRLGYWEELKTQKEAEKTAETRPICITLPNGQEKDGVAGETTPQMVADSIPLKNCLLARVLFVENVKVDTVAIDQLSEDSDDDEEKKEGQLWDMFRPLPASCKIWLLRFDDADAKHAFWHSSAHLLGLAVEQCFGGQLTIGPSLTRGFYYDFYAGPNFSVRDEHYREIEAAAEKAVSSKEAKFERMELSKDEAMIMFEDNPFKLALIANKVADNGYTSAYKCGPFIDLCMGPHIPNLSYIKAFKIEKHSSAYWLGDAKGDSLQRVYGISFPDTKQMKAHIQFMEEAKKRDHRTLGNQLGLFFFEPIYSPGCCFWTPLGARIYNKLCNLMRDEYIFRGFQEVHTPNLFSSELFKTSGHLANYRDCMFCLEVEGKEWAMKPMNCPGHCCIFKHLQPSYKQLPLRLADFGVLHRNEFSGSLTGLTRVRRFQQDDAHIFCRTDQVQQEVSAALEFLFFIYKLFGFRFDLVFATRPKKALGSLALWANAEEQLKQALDSCGMPWKYNRGDGAFYGPKIDIKLYDALDRAHQCGTIQLDFQLPLRFDLQYRTGEMPSDQAGELKSSDAPKQPDDMLKNPDGSLETELKAGFARPVMVHRAILGSIERMTAVVLEHTAGKLPFWLSPRQAIVCPISEKSIPYAQYVNSVLHQRGFDVDVDLSSNTINKKVREACVLQWNFILVVGASEQDSQTVMVRERGNPKDQYQMSVKDLIAKFEDLRDIAKRRADDIPPFVPPTQVE